MHHDHAGTAVELLVELDQRRVPRVPQQVVELRAGHHQVVERNRVVSPHEVEHADRPSGKPRGALSESRTARRTIRAILAVGRLVEGARGGGYPAFSATHWWPDPALSDSRAEQQKHPLVTRYAGRVMGNYDMLRCRHITDRAEQLVLRALGFDDYWSDVLASNLHLMRQTGERPGTRREWPFPWSPVVHDAV